MAKDGSEQAQGELATLMRDLHGELLLGGSRRIKHLAGRALELRYIAWPLVEGETVVSLVKRDGRVVSKESVGGPGPFLDETDNPLQSDLMVVYDVCRKLLADRPVDPDVVDALTDRLMVRFGGDVAESVEGGVIDCHTAGLIWTRSESWWRSQVGNDKPIPLRGSRGNAKLFAESDAAAHAKSLGIARKTTASR